MIVDLLVFVVIATGRWLLIWWYLSLSLQGDDCWFVGICRYRCREMIVDLLVFDVLAAGRWLLICWYMYFLLSLQGDDCWFVGICRCREMIVDLLVLYLLVFVADGRWLLICWYMYLLLSLQGDDCPFRHEPMALGNEITCELWENGKCFRKTCKFRHSVVEVCMLCIQLNVRLWGWMSTGRLVPRCWFDSSMW